MTKQGACVTSAGRSLAVLLCGAAAFAVPAAAQIARVTTSVSSVKVVVVPFSRPDRDSALSVGIANAVRDRLKVAYADRFNVVDKRLIDTNLVSSGFPVDMPLEPTNARQLARVLNARLLVEGVILQLGDDSIEVVGRLNEVTQTWPQSASYSVRVERRRAPNSANEIANRLADYFRSFDPAKQCQVFRQAQDYAKALTASNDALRRYSGSSQALLCMAQVMRAQNAPADTVIKVLERALNSDSMNVLAQWQVARYYEEQHDTLRLIQSLHHVLIADANNNEVRIFLARLHVGRNEPDSSIRVLTEGLDRNPNQPDLLDVRARVYAADTAMAGHYTLAAADLARIAELDTTKVDSAFVFRTQQIYTAAADTTNMILWTRRATERYPTMTGNWYLLALLLHAKADTTGAIAAIRGFLAQDANSARGHLVLASYMYETAQYDSAYVNGLAAGQADSTLRASVSGILFGVGARKLQPPPNYPAAVDILGRAREWSPQQGRQFEQISFYLGLGQYQLALGADSAANLASTPPQAAVRCEAARRLSSLVEQVNSNVTAGGRANPETAQQILTQAVPYYRQRAATFIRQARCPATPQP